MRVTKAIRVSLLASLFLTIGCLPKSENGASGDTVASGLSAEGIDTSSGTTGEFNNGPSNTNPWDRWLDEHPNPEQDENVPNNVLESPIVDPIANYDSLRQDLEFEKRNLSDLPEYLISNCGYLSPGIGFGYGHGGYYGNGISSAISQVTNPETSTSQPSYYPWDSEEYKKLQEEVQATRAEFETLREEITDYLDTSFAGNYDTVRSYACFFKRNYFQNNVDITLQDPPEMQSIKFGIYQNRSRRAKRALGNMRDYIYRHHSPILSLVTNCKTRFNDYRNALVSLREFWDQNLARPAVYIPQPPQINPDEIARVYGLPDAASLACSPEIQIVNPLAIYNPVQPQY